MKRWYQSAVLIMCVLLFMSLSACHSEQVEQTTGPVATTTQAVQIDPLELYEAACTALSGKTNLVLEFEGTRQRTVGGEVFTESSTGTASYTGRGTEELEALISETLHFGTYETQYIQSYLAGSGYCRVNNFNFLCSMTAEDFTAQQLPAVLLDSSLYGSVSPEMDGENIVLVFSDPLALESWTQAPDAAQLITAYGSLTLDADGTLLSAEYHAEYTLSTTQYKLDLSTTVDTPASLDLTASQPVYSDDCAPVSNLNIPRLLLQVVGDVYTADAMTVSYTDRLYSELFVVIREQSGSFNTYGSDSDFICNMSTQVALTNYTGTTSTNSQSITYLDGVYSCTVNGGEPTTVADVTAQQLRTSCEDYILSSLFELDCIAYAELTDIGDFLYIEFAGNESYTEAMFDSIYALFEVDLDSYENSTSSAGGYLVINKYSALPTALGVYVSRSHVVENVTYELTYQLDQSMDLPSASAYENITGQAAPEAEPLQTAAPLFYKVTGENGETMWLLGTIHVGDERTAYLPEEITAAFDSSDALAVEFNSLSYQDALLSDASLLTQLAQAYYYSDGTTLSSHLGSSLYAQLSPLMLASGSNSASAPYMKATLWDDVIGSFYLRQGSDLTSSKGVDRRLLTLATAQSKPIYEIESYLSQIQMLTGFSDALQSLLLTQTLEAGLISYCSEIDHLYELWCQGDEATLTGYLTADTSTLAESDQTLYQEYTTAMYTNRNAAMHTAATTYLQSGETVFYAVGLAHLLGEGGLVESLRAAGYTVEAVSYN